MWGPQWGNGGGFGSYAEQPQQEQTIGLNATFQQCIDVENTKISAIGENLVNFAELARQSQDLERIYGNLCEAYQAGVEALDDYRHKLTDASYLEQGYTQRMTERQRKAIEEVPAPKRPAVFHLMGGMVACMDRPTDKFREVLKKHQRAIFDNLIHLAKNESISAEAYYKNVIYIVNLLCLFDIVDQDSSVTFLAAIGTGILGFLAGTESDWRPLDALGDFFGGGDK